MVNYNNATRLERFVSDSRVHLVICPTSASGPEYVDQIATVTGQSSYDVHLRLRSGLPKPLLAFESIGEAQAVAHRLNELGVITIVYHENDLPPDSPFEVVRLVHTGGEFHLTDAIGQTLVLRDEELAQIVYGRCVHSAVETPVEAGLSARATDRAAASRDGSRSPRQLFVALFRHDARAPAIEFRQDRLDYSCLGSKRVSHSLQNLQTLAEVLRRMLPHVPMDHRLHNGHTTGVGEAFYNRRRVADSTAAHATLIHWAMLAERNGDRNLSV